MEKTEVTGVYKGVGYTVLALVALIIGWIWYVNNNYTFVFSNNFIASCQAQGASEQACGCALDYVKANYTFAQAKGLDTATSIPQELLDGIRNQCS